MFIIQLCLVFDCCQRLGGFETYRKPVKVLDKSHPLRFFGFLSSGSVSIWCQPQLNGHKTHSTAQQHLPLLYLQTFHLSCLLFPVSLTTLARTSRLATFLGSSAPISLISPSRSSSSISRSLSLLRVPGACCAVFSLCRAFASKALAWPRSSRRAPGRRRRLGLQRLPWWPGFGEQSAL